MISRVLERFIQEQMIASGIPGLSLVLLKGGATSERHFGFRELQGRLPPSGATRYGLGSVTKVFTAIAVLQLVQEGRIALNDEIAQHLSTEAEAFGNTTVRDLLAHASGIPALGWSETKMSSAWPMDGFPVGSFEDLLVFLDGAAAWRVEDTGVSWHYSNEGYLLLGRLLEVCDGEPYTTSLQRRVLGPLGMERSTFDASEVAADADAVQPYMQDDDGRLIHGRNLYGTMPAAGGLVSTSNDMTKLVQLLLARGRLPNGRPLLGQDLVEAMVAADVRVDPSTPFDDYALWNDAPRVNGAGLQRHIGVLGHDVWAHGGGVMGGTSYIAAVPDADIGVVLLANAHGYPLAQLALVCVAAALGAEPDALPFVQRQRLLARAAGRYASWAGTIGAELVPRAWGAELRFDFVPGGRTVTLVPIEHDPDGDRTRWLALGGGRPGMAETKRRDGTYQLVFERYAFRRLGDNNG